MRFALRSVVDAHRGRIERARAALLPLIERLEHTEQNYWPAFALSILGFVEFSAGDNDAVNSALTRMQDRLDAIGIKDAPSIRSEPFHVESLLAVGELDRAREVLARLEKRGRIVPSLWKRHSWM